MNRRLTTLALCALAVTMTGARGCTPEEEATSHLIMVSLLQQREAPVMTCVQFERASYGATLSCQVCDGFTPGGRCPCTCVGPGLEVVRPPAPPIPSQVP